MEETNGVWKTLDNGTHIFIENGQTIEQAINENLVTDTERKRKQLDIIQKNNAMQDEYHTGIRSENDIRTAQEAFRTKINEDEDYLYPDFSKEDGEKALKEGKIKIYSSKEIKAGSFISPSKMMAQDYAGSGKVYEQLVDINSVAWIDSNEGQYTPID